MGVEGWHMTLISASKLWGTTRVDWSRLTQSLYVVTFGTQDERDRRRCCNLCLESDHVEEQCTLFTVSQKHSCVKRVSREECSLTRGPPSHIRGGSRMACFAWNQGDCRFLACKYWHVCVQCGGEHWISRCSRMLAERESKTRKAKS